MNDNQKVHKGYNRYNGTHRQWYVTMFNNSTQVKNQSKRKTKETVFKPENNQPIIKSVITPKLVKEKAEKNLIKHQQVDKVRKVQKASSEKEPSLTKKRQPPTPPERDQPSKRLNMNPQDEESAIGNNNNTSNGTGNNTNPLPKPGGPLINPELLQLREMLKEDMKEMLIKPLEDRMTALEESHVKLEAKGELM